MTNIIPKNEKEENRTFEKFVANRFFAVSRVFYSNKYDTTGMTSRAGLHAQIHIHSYQNAERRNSKIP